MPGNGDSVKHVFIWPAALLVPHPAHVNGGPLSHDCQTLKPLGAHTLVLEQINGEKVATQVPPRFDVRLGQPCTAMAGMGQAHFRAPASEVRL